MRGAVFAGRGYLMLIAAMALIAMICGMSLFPRPAFSASTGNTDSRIIPLLAKPASQFPAPIPAAFGRGYGNVVKDTGDQWRQIGAVLPRGHAPFTGWFVELIPRTSNPNDKAPLRNVIHTVAHGFFDEKGQLKRRLSDIKFILGPDHTARTSKRFDIDHLECGSVTPYDDKLDNDWCLIFLTENLPAGLEPLSGVGANDFKAANNMEVTEVGFDQMVSSNKYRAVKKCQIMEQRSGGEFGAGVIETDCPGMDGSSGSPIFVFRGSRPLVIAHMVADADITAWGFSGNSLGALLRYDDPQVKRHLVYPTIDEARRLSIHNAYSGGM